MKIMHRYVLQQFARNFVVSLVVFTTLFMIVDFFDRIDNIMREEATLGTVALYFLLKIPLMANLLLPIAMLSATLFTIGILSKNSELTAMRAAGATVFWIGRPIMIFGLGVSLFSMLLTETVTPYTSRRAREIYNIDIMKKHETGGYSQEDFWWREGNSFFSVKAFDSRSETLFGLSRFDMNDSLAVTKRFDAEKVRWLDSFLGWNMSGITEYRFTPKSEESALTQRSIKELPLPIPKKPSDFYDAETDPRTMSFSRLRKFIKAQQHNGVRITGYLADLYDKTAEPFTALIVTFVAFPFVVRPARNSSLARNFLAGLIFGFSYYAIHSLCIALGRAEILPGIFAAWLANLVMLFIGVVLNLGAESPS